MSIVQNLNPSKPAKSVDLSSRLSVVRDQSLQFTLNVLTVIAGLVALAVTLVVAQSGISQNIFIAWGLVILFSVITVLRNISFRLRVILFSSILLIASSYLLLADGFTTHGLLLMMGFVIIVTLFNGVSDGILSGVVAIGVVLLTGTLVTSGSFSLPSVLPPTNPGFDWIIGGLSFIGLASISIGVLSITLASLQKTVRDQETKISEQSTEISTLSVVSTRQKDELDLLHRHLELHMTVSQIYSEQRSLPSFYLEVVNLIAKSFSLYHAAIYFLSESGDELIIQSGSGDAGKVLTEQKFHIKINRNSMMGYVALNNEPRYAPDVSEDVTFLQNPMLSYTKSELAVPISHGNVILGILDLQADRLNAFTGSDIRAFQQLGTLIAALITTRSLSENIQQIKSEVEQTRKQNVLKSWKNHILASKKHYGYQVKDQKIMETPQLDQHANSAMASETIIQETTTLENGSYQTVVAIPIMLRGQSFGVLDMHFSAKVIPQDLMQLLEATSSRLALALENARLLEELKMRADREHLVGDISAKMRSSTAVQDILGAAAEELGRTLGISEVIVHLRPEEE